MKLLIFFAALSLGFACSAESDHRLVDALSGLESMKFVAALPLENSSFPLFHPQGVKVIGRDVYVSTVEGSATGVGYLIKFKMDSALNPSRLLPMARTTFDSGPGKNLNHAGGIDVRGNTLILPLAVYRPKGPAQLLGVDLKNFGSYKVLATINDHIGTVVSQPRAVYGMNWDTKKIYAFDQSNHEKPRTLFGDKWNYQDCKHVSAGYALCSALKGHIFRHGEIHLIHFVPGPTERIEIVHRIGVGKFNGDGSRGGGRPLTNNAMDFQPIHDRGGSRLLGIRFFFIPHDGDKAHLLIFDSMI